MKKLSSLDKRFYGTPNEPAVAEAETPENTKSEVTSTDIKQNTRNIKLQKLDDLFATGNSNTEVPIEAQIQQIALSELHPFKREVHGIEHGDYAKGLR